MKLQKHSLLAGAAIVSLFVFSLIGGCKKSSDTGKPSNLDSATLIPTVPLAPAPDFSADFAAKMLAVGPDSFRSVSSKSYYQSATKKWFLRGFVPAASQDTLVMFVYIPTTFTLNQPINVSPTNCAVEYSDTKLLMDYYYANIGNGNITVTSLDTVGHKIAGTFSGVMYNVAGPGGYNSQDSLIVKNGQFNTTYTVQ